MKYVCVIVLFLVLGCGDQSNKTESTKTSSKVSIEFICSNYTNETAERISFGRITKNNGKIELTEGDISFDENLNTVQTIQKNTPIKESEMDSIIQDYKERGFRSNFDEIGKVVFVQVQPKDDTDMEVLYLRHELEDQINKKLTSAGLGEWIAGDLGPGGANMLFEVKDWNNSIYLILDILNTRQLLDKCVISKRLYTSEQDWNYEIIFPIDFHGIFNQM